MGHSQRIAKLCKYLVSETAWLPHVICGELPIDLLAVKDETLLAELPEAINITRVSNFLASSLAQKLKARGLCKPMALVRKLLVRPDAHGDWIRGAVAAAGRQFPGGKGIDAILVSGPPNSVYVAGARLSKVWGVPLVLDMRDPWMPFWGPQSPIYRWLGRTPSKLEKSCYTQAASIILNTDVYAQAFRQQFPEFAGKTVVVPNGFDPEDLDWAMGPSLRTPGEPEDTVHLLNLGGIRGQGLEEALLKNLADYLAENPIERHRVKVHFVGGTPEQLDGIFQAAGVGDNCKAHGVVPANAVGRPLAEADIYLLLQPGHYSFSIPSKLFYYLAGGGYILAMIPSPLVQSLKEKFGDDSKIFEFAEPQMGKATIARMIQRARQSPRPRPGDSFPDYALPYDRRAIARQVGAVLDRVVAAAKSAT